jgi:uncharacterized membrane protein
MLAFTSVASFSLKLIYISSFVFTALAILADAILGPLVLQIKHFPLLFYGWIFCSFSLNLLLRALCFLRLYTKVKCRFVSKVSSLSLSSLLSLSSTSSSSSLELEDLYFLSNHTRSFLGNNC